MAESGSDVRSGIGARLRAGREKMGLTQLQAAEKLHVDSKIVESLEAERFEVLGAPVYVRGHLKRYSEFIGEKTAELLDIYGAATTQPALPDLTKLPKAAPDSSPSRLAVPALVVLIGFVLLGLVWWVVKSVGGPEGTQPKRGPQPVAIAPEVSRDPAVVEEPVSQAVPSASDAAGANAAGIANGAAAAHTSAGAANGVVRGSSVAAATGAGAQSAAIRAARGASGGSASGAATVPAINGAARSTPPAGGSVAGSAPAVAGKPMEVTLRFTADSWVEVYDANGEKLFYDIGTADSSHTVSGTPPFRVHVGNAPGVSLDVNGKPATVPANAVQAEQARFVINRSGRIVRARSQADGG